MFSFKNVIRRLSLIVGAVMILAGCSGRRAESAEELRQREAALLESGLIYYGHDPDEEAFDDMYYVFIADEEDMEEASIKALQDFKDKVDGMTAGQRSYLGRIFTDFADLAEMAAYAYKDRPVAVPSGWTDLGAKNPQIAEVINKYSVNGFFLSGLKCSLMGKGERQVLVFAGTDFPSSWSDMNQVIDFLLDAYEDVNGALSSEATQVVLASKLVAELLEKGFVNEDCLEFAGHSLGGRLASEMSVQYGCPAVIFNAAGVSPEVYERYEEARKEADSDWRGYVVDVIAANDPLTCAQKYISGESDPFVSATANLLSVDKKSVESALSLGLGVLGAVADLVVGESGVVSSVMGAAGDLVDNFYERDYRAIGAKMPIREDMAGHGIKELAVALRQRAELCK